MNQIFSKILQSIADAIVAGNSKGLPFPMVRDPRTGTSSATLTMVVVSFGLCILLLAGKVTKVVGDVEYANVLWLHGISLSAYLGRKFQGKGKDVQLGDIAVNTETQEIKKVEE